MDVAVIILAAGFGVRMKSDLPKVYHSICGKPMINWVIEAVISAGISKNIYVVVGYKGELVKKACASYKVDFVEQKERLGTGHAVMQAQHLLKDFDGTTLVLNGDVPLIKPETIMKLVRFHESRESAVTILTADFEKPNSYGRIVRDENDNVVKIVEQRDATGDELKIKEVNTGTYCFNNKDLFDALPKLSRDNAQNEYYLTDAIGILRSSGSHIYAFKADDMKEVIGVNTKEDLVYLEGLCKGEL